MLDKQRILEILNDNTDYIGEYYGDYGINRESYENIANKILESRVSSSSREALYYSKLIQHKHRDEQVEEYIEVIESYLKNIKELLTDSNS